jgi:3-methyl-2-oxobutanoate hydroxymethyltransferase
MNALDFKRYKAEGRKISMVTCYDAWSARLVAKSRVDCLLVGDSLSMVMHGHPTTIPATVDVMALHTAAVARGAPKAFIVADMPFLAARGGLSGCMEAVRRLMQAGASAVKIEGVDGQEEVLRSVVLAGVPVMGHLGLTPQSVHQLGGNRVQGRGRGEGEVLEAQARRLEEIGCFSLVLECVPAALAERVSRALEIPAVGIGAGPGTDGQVLVLQDMLGMNADFQPRFLKRFLDGERLVVSALDAYAGEVRSGAFPTEKESY